MTGMDIVYIRGLRIATVIGVYDWERQVRQIVSLDLEMGANISRAAETDDIEYALNYKAVADRLTAFISGSEFLLLETMAEQVATIVRTEFSVPWLRLRIGKPDAIADAEDVGVLIERGIRS